jgi:hypothetical protein
MASIGMLGTTHFHLDRHRAFIRGHGQQAVISPVLQCPCLLDDHQFNPVCPTCHGTGRFYPDLTFVTTFLGVREASERTYNEAGTWTGGGELQVTLLPSIRLYERDKVRLVAIKEVFADEVLVHGLDDTVRFRYGVEVYVVADRSTVYRQQVDYVLTLPATITWLAGGRSPGLGQQYAIRYAAFPEYLVVPSTPRLRVEHNIQQSQVVLIQRVDKVSEEF